MRFHPVVVLSIFLAGGLFGLFACGSPSTNDERMIPEGFSTYSPGSELFSVAYPSDWEVVPLSVDVDQLMTELFQDPDETLSFEEIAFLFMAGKPTQLGFDPNCSIGIQPRPLTFISVEEMGDAQMRTLREIADSFRLLSSESVVMNGRDALIAEYELYFSNLGEVHNLALYRIEGAIFWILTCGTVSGFEAYSEYKDDFRLIANSFEVHGRDPENLQNELALVARTRAVYARTVGLIVVLVIVIAYIYRLNRTQSA